MDQFYLLYLGSIAALPIILTGILWLARQDMRRSILVLSALALGSGLLATIVFTVLVKALADSQGLYTDGSSPISSGTDSAMNLLLTIQEWHSIALDIAMTLQSAAWILALYSAIQARRGRWLALIAVCATVSSFVELFAVNLSPATFTFVYIPQFGPLATLLAAHPFGALFVVNVLTLLASAATLLYCQVGLRATRATGLVPGAIMAPAEGPIALPALPVSAPGEGLEDDVEFVVERLPNGRSAHR